MKIFVIAHTGQLGKELCALIKDGKHDLCSFSRKELDITDHEKVRRTLEECTPDIVINTAAHHATIEGENSPSSLFAVNAFSLLNIAKICRNFGTRLVTFTSDYVFDGRLGRPYREDDRPHPIQYFGLSKYVGELVALNYNPNTIVIRTSGVYGGVEGSQSKRNFVLNMINESKTKKFIEVTSEQIVSPTYAHDLAIATMDLIMRKDVTAGIYHLTNTGYCSWADFSKEIMRLTHSSTEIKPVDRRGESGGIRRPIFSALENTRAKSFGIKLPSWRDGLKRYIDYLTGHV